MPIRNRNCITRILHEGEEHGISNPFIEFESYFNDHEYYCVHFTTADHLLMIEDVIPSETLDEIRVGYLHLLLSNNLEAMPDNISAVIEMANRLNISTDKITFTSCGYDIHSTIIKCVVTDTFEFLQYAGLKPVPVKGPLVKRYIYPNRRWRLHRPALVALLAAKDVLQYGNVSLRKMYDTDTWKTHWPELKSSMPALIEYEDKILSLPELYIDNANFDVGYPDEMDTTYYMQSYFGVASETNYYSSSRFITEKTYRFIEYEMPFIIVNRPHSLSLLRERGYQTFHPYINENYDLEEDNNKRLLMIADEIERLCKLPEEQINELLMQLKPICEYNRKVLENRKYPDDFIWLTK